MLGTTVQEHFKIELLALLDLPENLSELISMVISMVIYKFRKLEVPSFKHRKKGGVAVRNKILPPFQNKCNSRTKHANQRYV